jgi:rhodanese-related sulfurtransferase
VSGSLVGLERTVLDESDGANVPPASVGHAGSGSMPNMNGHPVDPLDVPAGAVIVDLRPTEQWAAGHPPGAISFPVQEKLADPVGAFSELESIWGPELPDANPLFLICEGGVAADWLAYHMACAGRRVRPIRGGVPAWTAAGLPVVQ